MGSGFYRHRSAKFHPSGQISTLRCKIGPPSVNLPSVFACSLSFPRFWNGHRNFDRDGVAHERSMGANFPVTLREFHPSLYWRNTPKKCDRWV